MRPRLVIYLGCLLVVLAITAIKLSLRGAPNHAETPVRFMALQPSDLPERLLKPPLSFQFTLASDDDVARAKETLAPVLTAISEAGLRPLLHQVGVAWDIRCDNRPVGGFYFGHTVVLDMDGYRAGFQEIRRGFYHEFSSIVLHEYSSRFPYTQWKDLNGPGNWYALDKLGGRQSLMHKYDSIDRATLRSAGFLTPYSATCLENDFNVMTEWLVYDANQLDKAAAASPRIAGKAKLAVQFWNEVAPGLIKY